MTPENFAALVPPGPQPHPLRLRGPGRPRHAAELLSQARRGPYSYLFESVQGGEKWGRYSIIGLPCRTVLKVYGNRSVERDGAVIEQAEADDPLAWIEPSSNASRSPTIPACRASPAAWSATSATTPCAISSRG
jgi:anthranilate synthase component 1